MFLTEEMQGEETVNVLRILFDAQNKKIDQSSELTKTALISKVEPNSESRQIFLS